MALLKINIRLNQAQLRIVLVHNYHGDQVRLLTESMLLLVGQFPGKTIQVARKPVNIIVPGALDKQQFCIGIGQTH